MTEDLTPSLVVALRGGDEGAATLLDRLYRKRLQAFAWGYLRDHAAAEDAVQDVFVKVMQNATVPDAFRAWIYRITRNHCLNLLRGMGRRRDNARLATHVEVWASAAGALTRFADEERRGEVAQALADLTPEQQEVLRLRYADGLSRGEVASVLDVPESTVKSRLFAALQRVRQKL